MFTCRNCAEGAGYTYHDCLKVIWTSGPCEVKGVACLGTGIVYDLPIMPNPCRELADDGLDEATRAMNRHEAVVTYTVDDDGIWLACQCGAMFKMGQWPTISDLQDEYDRHVAREEFSKPWRPDQ